jgi:hypothetical protein
MMARFRSRWLQRILLLLLAPALKQVAASQSWTRLATPDFDLYTNLNRKQAALLINELEEARRALMLVPIGDTANDHPVRVIAFRSPAEYARYRAHDASSAYYLRSGGQDYIVWGQNLAADSKPLVHEYVHHLLHQRYRELPLWLDEGLADLYSTVVQEDRGLRIGLPPADRLDWLKMDAPAYDLKTLFSIRQSSFAKMEHLTPRSRFYAESWLLVHMLRFSPEYENQFQDFLDDIEQGKKPEDAFNKRYGKTLTAVHQDMVLYLKADRMPTEILHESRQPQMPAVTISDLQAKEWQAVLADLRSALRSQATRVPPELEDRL